MKGLNVLLKVGGKAVAAQSNAQLARNTKAVDVSNKIDLKWDDFLPGSKNWSIVCTGAWVVNDEALTALENSYMNNEKVEVRLDNGIFTYSGNAIITSFPIGAMYNQDVTYSINLQGCGPLVKS